METPLKLEIRGFEPSTHVLNLINSEIEKFEQRCSRITSCKVVIRAPGAHHRMGEPYAVTIYMALPNNRAVSVGNSSIVLDRRHSDMSFAIHDAFRRAVRQLRDQTRRLQGSIKKHEETPVGRIASLQRQSDCGFLETEDGQRIYFHAHSVLGGRFHDLVVGDRVAFHEEIGEKGLQASTVRVLRPASRRPRQGAKA